MVLYLKQIITNFNRKQKVPPKLIKHTCICNSQFMSCSASPTTANQLRTFQVAMKVRHHKKQKIVPQIPAQNFLCGNTSFVVYVIP